MTCTTSSGRPSAARRCSSTLLLGSPDPSRALTPARVCAGNRTPQFAHVLQRVTQQRRQHATRQTWPSKAAKAGARWLSRCAASQRCTSSCVQLATQRTTGSRLRKNCADHPHRVMFAEQDFAVCQTEGCRALLGARAHHIHSKGRGTCAHMQVSRRLRVVLQHGRPPPVARLPRRRLLLWREPEIWTLCIAVHYNGPRQWCRQYNRRLPHGRLHYSVRSRYVGTSGARACCWLAYACHFFCGPRCRRLARPAILASGAYLWSYSVL